MARNVEIVTHAHKPLILQSGSCIPAIKRNIKTCSCSSNKPSKMGTDKLRNPKQRIDT